MVCGGLFQTDGMRSLHGKIHFMFESAGCKKDTISCSVILTHTCVRLSTYVLYICMINKYCTFILEIIFNWRIFLHVFMQEFFNRK
jgi:hypothetical protein